MTVRALVRVLVLALLAGAAAAPAASATVAPTNGMLSFGYHADGFTRQIGTINQDGSGFALQADGWRSSVFSPDGNRELVWPNTGGQLTVRNRGGGGELPFSDPTRNIWTAFWSPDGTRIGYLRAADGNSAEAEVWTASPDGTGRTPLTADGMAKLALAWGQTAQGSRIAYVGVRPLDPADPCYGWQLWLMAADGTGASCVPSVAAYQQMLAYGIRDLAWSPDGTRIAFVSTFDGGRPLDCSGDDGACTSEGSIWVADLAGGTVTRILDGHYYDTLQAWSIAWAPDGTTLAFAGYTPARHWKTTPSTSGVYLLPPAGGTPARVTPEAADPTQPPMYADVDWQPCVAGVTTSCVSVTPQRAVQVAVTGPGRVTSVPAGISCPGTCSAAFDEGTSVRLTASATGTATFGGWGAACAGSALICDLTAIGGDTSVTAEFTAPAAMRHVTVASEGAGRVTSEPAGISCPGTCDAAFADGTTVTLTATSTGGAFQGWDGACASAGTAASCELTLTDDAAVGAQFAGAPVTRRLTLSVTGTGTVTGAPGRLACPGRCTADLADGARVALAAHPAKGQELRRWGGACGSTTTLACTVSMGADRAVTAVFGVDATPPRVAATATTAQVAGRAARLGLRCADRGAGACTVRIGLRTKARVLVGGRRRIVALGSATASLQPGVATTVTISLSRAGRALLTGPGARTTLKATATGSATDAAGNRSRLALGVLTLRRAAR